MAIIAAKGGEDAFRGLEAIVVAVALVSPGVVVLGKGVGGSGGDGRRSEEERRSVAEEIVLLGYVANCACEEA